MFLFGPVGSVLLAVAAFYVAGSIYVDPLLRRRPISVAVAFVAVILGLLSLLPFLEYLPFAGH